MCLVVGYLGETTFKSQFPRPNIYCVMFKQCYDSITCIHFCIHVVQSTALVQIGWVDMKFVPDIHVTPNDESTEAPNRVAPSGQNRTCPMLKLMTKHPPQL